MRPRNFGGWGGKGDLEKSRFDCVFLNDGVPKHFVSKSLFLGLVQKHK